jgi:hypothetical protein
MNLYMLSNHPGLKTLDILIMLTGCPRRYMGSSKLEGLGMSVFATSSSKRASRSGPSTQPYSQRNIIMIFSFVKFMLMT